MTCSVDLRNHPLNPAIRANNKGGADNSVHLFSK